MFAAFAVYCPVVKNLQQVWNLHNRPITQSTRPPLSQPYVQILRDFTGMGNTVKVSPAVVTLTTSCRDTAALLGSVSRGNSWKTGRFAVDSRCFSIWNVLCDLFKPASSQLQASFKPASSQQT